MGKGAKIGDGTVHQRAYVLKHMNEPALAVILEYIEECLFEPKANWPRFFFDERSYSRWAAFEIVNDIMKNPLVSPTATIERFMIMMDMKSCVAEDTKASRIFSIARDTAEDILLLLV